MLNFSNFNFDVVITSFFHILIGLRWFHNRYREPLTTFLESGCNWQTFFFTSSLIFIYVYTYIFICILQFCKI